jgi:5-methylcytosine-specific restriction endonuclease McrA
MPTYFKTKKKGVKISSLRNKADRLLQELGMSLYQKCLVCNKKMSCLHHFYPKSKSANLRYDLDNCIPICNSCHLQHHTGNPDIHATVINKLGKDWYKKLRAKRLKPHKENKVYYLEIIERLNEQISKSARRCYAYLR